MPEFRHVTNLQQPFDALDEALITNIGTGNYVIGAPLKGKSPGAKSVTELQADNIVGLYSTYDAIGAKSVRNQTGWVIPPGDWQKLPVLANG